MVKVLPLWRWECGAARSCAFAGRQTAQVRTRSEQHLQRLSPCERTIPARQTPFLRASQPPKQAPEAGNWAFRIPCEDSSDLKLILFSFLCIYILLCICVLFGHVLHVHMCVSTHVNCMCILYMWVSQRSA